MATWAKFGEKFSEKFSDAYSKADTRRAEKKEKEDEKRKKLRADVAKFENAIRSASGEEIELATGIKPSEGKAVPKGMGVVARDVISPADQIFKKLKNKNLMDRFAGLESIVERLPEARTELRSMRMLEERDKKWQRDKADAKSESILAAGEKRYYSLLDKKEAEEKAAEAKKEKLQEEAEARLTDVVREGQTIKEQMEKDRVLSDRYQGIVADAVGDPDLQQKWMNPQYQKSFLGTRDAPERLETLSEYVEGTGMVPETSKGLSTGFVSEARAAKVDAKAEQLLADSEVVVNAAYLKLGGETDWSKGLSRAQKGEAQRKAIGIEAKINANIRVAERAAKVASTKEYNYYRNQSVNRSSKTVDGVKDGLPLWVIFEDVDTKGNDVAQAKVAPDTLLSPEDREKLRSSLKARQMLLDLDKPKKEGGPKDPLGIR